MNKANVKLGDELNSADSLIFCKDKHICFILMEISLDSKKVLFLFLTVFVVPQWRRG